LPLACPQAQRVAGAGAQRGAALPARCWGWGASGQRSPPLPAACAGRRSQL